MAKRPVAAGTMQHALHHGCTLLTSTPPPTLAQVPTHPPLRLQLQLDLAALC